MLVIHLGLRPMAVWIDSKRKLAPDVEVSYRLRVLCAEKDQVLIRSIVLRHVNATPRMTIQGISTQEGDGPDRVNVVVDIFSTVRNDRALEEVVQRLNIEPSVVGVGWEKRV